MKRDLPKLPDSVPSRWSTNKKLTDAWLSSALLVTQEFLRSDPQKPTYRYKPVPVAHSTGFQTQSAFLQPHVPAPHPWRITLLRSLQNTLSSSGE